MGHSPQVTVVVLGDLGRSPRMQYHALALAQQGAHVRLIGERGSTLPAFLGHPHIEVVQVPASRGVRGVVAAAWRLWRAAAQGPRPDVLLAQTPPAIPTLLVAWWIARRRRCRLVFDWHNLGWTMLAHRQGRVGVTARLARSLERAWAPLAHAHLAVSSALASSLLSVPGIRAVSVLRDRPLPEQARQVGPDAVRRLRRVVYEAAGVEAGGEPAVVLCPTSWTSDEDPALLLETADQLERVWATEGPDAGVVLAISGDGPGRAAFEARLHSRVARRVRVCTLFVAADDYPALVRAADVGVSLHVSSSQLDLPMKICDLFAAGVPVCAWDCGPVLRELVQPGIDAALFDSAEALAATLDDLLRCWPMTSPALVKLRAGAAQAQAGPDWIAGWQTEARAVVLGDAA